MSGKEQLIKQIKALNKGQAANSEFIWRAFEGVDGDQTISYFCNHLMESVIHSQKKIYLLQNQERLYATLLFIQLYRNRLPKRVAIIQHLRICVQKKPSSIGKTFMHFILSENREDTYIQFFISRLLMIPQRIEDPSKIITQIQRQIQQTKDYMNRIKHSHPSKSYEILKKRNLPKQKTIDTKLLSFGYIAFIDHIKCNGFQLKYQQYQYIINAFAILMEGVQTLKSIFESIPVLVHLIIKCITFYGCPFESQLKKLIIWASQLRAFPGYIGSLGCQLFNVIYNQLKLPGFSFRKKVRRDFPSLDQKQSVFLNKQFYMVTDRQQIFSRQQDRSLNNLRKLSILHALKISGMAEKQVVDFRSFLKHLGKDDTFHLYDQCMRILDVVMKLDQIPKIKQVLRQCIPKLVSQTKARVGDPHGQLNMQALQSQQFDILANKMNKRGFFKYPKFQIITVPIVDFTNMKGNGHNLHHIIQKNKADYQNHNFLKNKIPFIFHGDGYSFIRFVKVIAEYQQTTTIEDLKLFQIYYVPKHECAFRPGIASFLASKDHWYRKFIYNVYKQKMLYPHLQITNNNKDLFPFYLYNKMLQLYLRQANCTIQLRVFKCLLTMSQSDLVQCIYMTSFFAIGLFCQAEIIKMTKEKEKGKQERYSHKQIIQIIEQKIKKNMTMHVSIEIQYADEIGGYLKTKKEKSMKIQDLQICNIPRDYFMGKQPNPMSPNLQMTILTEQNGKIFRKQISQSDNFKEKRSKDETENAFRDLFICETIRSITIQNLDTYNPLRLMVDGTVANKIKKIQIQPAISTNGMPVSLPIQCFLPING